MNNPEAQAAFEALVNDPPKDMAVFDARSFHEGYTAALKRIPQGEPVAWYATWTEAQLRFVNDEHKSGWAAMYHGPRKPTADDGPEFVGYDWKPLYTLPEPK